jgi:hypothetical protein
MHQRPRQLLRMGNSDLRRDKIWTWSLPAYVIDLPDGRTFNACPAAGACAQPCYARKGTYRFSNVRAAHLRNLMFVLEDLSGWESQLRAELADARFVGAYVRIHDAGDFFSDEYLAAWLRVIKDHPGTHFYAYTKEVRRFKALPARPGNMTVIYSWGGRYDHMIEDTDRQADVFPTLAALEAAGFTDQADSDLLAIHGPHKVGIVVNNHPGAAAGLGGESFGGLQRARHRANMTS